MTSRFEVMATSSCSKAHDTDLTDGVRATSPAPGRSWRRRTVVPPTVDVLSMWDAMLVPLPPSTPDDGMGDRPRSSRDKGNAVMRAPSDEDAIP